MYDAIVIGAGFAGSVMAERIASVLNHRVLVIEKRNHTGGNCYDYKDEHGIIVHKYGPHLFHTDDREVWEYLSTFTEWRRYSHRVLAVVDGKKIVIPFNLHSLRQAFPADFARRLEEKLLNHYRYGEKVPVLELMNHEDSDLRLLARYVYENIFVNYTAKQWNKRPEELDPAVTARVPVSVSHDDRYFTDRFQGVPREGYATIFDRMLSHPRITVSLDTDYRDIVKLDESSGTITYQGKEFLGRVIFTGMIDELFGCRFGRLPYRSLDLRFETLAQEFYQEVATVNYPNDHDFTRITEFKHIHPAETRKTTILREYPEPYKHGENTPFYPVVSDENRALYRSYKKLSEAFRTLVLVGRLADYQYYDMDDIVKRSLAVFEEQVR